MPEPYTFANVINEWARNRILFEPSEQLISLVPPESVKGFLHKIQETEEETIYTFYVYNESLLVNGRFVLARNINEDISTFTFYKMSDLRMTEFEMNDLIIPSGGATFRGRKSVLTADSGVRIEFSTSDGYLQQDRTIREFIDGLKHLI